MLLLRLVATEVPRTNAELAQLSRAALRTIEAGFSSYSLYGRAPTIEEYLRLGNAEAAQWSRLCSDLLAQQNPIDAENALIVVITPCNQSLDEHYPILVPNLDEPYDRTLDQYLPNWANQPQPLPPIGNQLSRAAPEPFSTSYLDQLEGTPFDVPLTDQGRTNSAAAATAGSYSQYAQAPPVLEPVRTQEPWRMGTWPDTTNNAPPPGWLQPPNCPPPCSGPYGNGIRSQPVVIPPVTLASNTQVTKVITVEKATSIKDLKPSKKRLKTTKRRYTPKPRILRKKKTPTVISHTETTNEPQ